MIKKLFVLIFVCELCFLPVLAQKTNNKKKSCDCPKAKVTIKSINLGKEAKDTKINSLKVLKKNYDKYNYDEASRIIKIMSKDKGVTKVIYDEYGRLKSKNKSNIEFENYYYDILGRKTKIEYKSNGKKDKVIFNYYTPPESYKLGHLTEKIEKHEHSFYKWDGRRLLEEKKIINGNKFITKYKYNKKGNPSEIHYPSGLIVSYQYNDKNKIKKVSVTIGKKTIEAFKTRKEKDSTIIEYGNGLKTEISSNIDKRIVSMKTGDIQDLEFRFNNKGLIDRVKDNKNPRNKKDFYYDQHERLITAYGPWGKIQYRYDDMDNLLFKKENSKKLEIKYLKKSGRIKELKENGKRIDYQYDKLGRTIKYGDMTFTYNERGRLSKIYKNKKLIVELFYNYKGQRVIEKRGDKEYYYIYDNKDRVLANYDNQGNILKEYIYNKEIPLGFVKDKRIHYYHYDLMFFPVLITNKSAKAIRQIQYKPYGKIISIKGDLRDSLRFPGQFEIKGSNLYYNINRSYYQRFGKYIEPEQIINEDNIYQYAKCNPIMFSDINGLKVLRNFYYGSILAFTKDVFDFFSPKNKYPIKKDYEGFFGVQLYILAVCAKSDCYKKADNKKYKKCGLIGIFAGGIGMHPSSPGEGLHGCVHVTFETKNPPSNFDPPDFREMKGWARLVHATGKLRLPFQTYWGPTTGRLVVGKTITIGSTASCLGIGKIKSWFGIEVEIGAVFGKSYLISQKEVCCSDRCCLLVK